MQNCRVRQTHGRSDFIYKISFLVYFLPILGGQKAAVSGMVCSRQPRSFQGVHPHGRPDGFRGSFISSRRPLVVSSIPSSVATDLPTLFPRELRRQSEIHLHSWFTKHHKNKPTPKKTVRLDDGKD